MDPENQIEDRGETPGAPNAEEEGREDGLAHNPEGPYGP